MTVCTYGTDQQTWLYKGQFLQFYSGAYSYPKYQTSYADSFLLTETKLQISFVDFVSHGVFNWTPELNYLFSSFYLFLLHIMQFSIHLSKGRIQLKPSRLYVIFGNFSKIQIIVCFHLPTLIQLHTLIILSVLAFLLKLKWQLDMDVFEVQQKKQKHTASDLGTCNNHIPNTTAYSPHRKAWYPSCTDLKATGGRSSRSWLAVFLKPWRSRCWVLCFHSLPGWWSFSSTGGPLWAGRGFPGLPRLSRASKCPLTAKYEQF